MRHRLQIQNETLYSTADLRRFFRAAMKACGDRGHKTVKVVYRRGDGPRGWGFYGDVRAATWMKIALPRDPAKLDLGQVARTYRHEHAHNLGIRHGEMEPDLRYAKGPDPEWVKDHAIRFMAPILPTRAEQRSFKAAHASKMLVRAETRLKRAQTIVKRWRTRVRYYQRREIKAAALSSST